MKRFGFFGVLAGSLLLVCFLSWPVFEDPGRAWQIPRAEAGEQKTDQVKDTVKKAWEGIYQTSFDPQRPGCSFDYGPKGMRNTYCYLASIFSYEKLIALSGMEPFLKGPHGPGELDLDNKSDFGHYNPKFVVWMKDNLIPGAGDDKFKWVTEPIYDRYLKKTARSYYLAAEIVFSDPDLLARSEKNYLESIKQKTACCLGFDNYYQSFPQEYFGRYLEDDFYYGNVLDCAFAFWVRRHLDGTWQEFRLGLEKLLATYDHEFLADRKKEQTRPQVASSPQPAGQPVIEDRILKNFLTDFIDLVQKHDWDRVLTFFSPENFQMQKEIGIGQAQYLAEGMGLNYVDNKLMPRPNDNSEFANLNAIVSLEITTVGTPDGSGYFTVDGLAVLFDGSTRTVQLIIRRTQTGGYIIEPAVG